MVVEVAGARLVVVEVLPRTLMDDATRPLAGDEHAAHDGVAQCRDGLVQRDRAIRPRHERRQLAVRRPQYPLRRRPRRLHHH